MVMVLLKVGVAVVREPGGPRERRLGPVAAAVQVAADAADAQAQDDARGTDVHRQPGRHLGVDEIGEDDRGGQDQAAVEGEAAAGDVDDVPEVLEDGQVGAGVVVVVLQDVRQAGADDAGRQRDQGGVDEDVRVEPLAPGQPGGEPLAAEEREDHHQAVAVEGDRGGEERHVERQTPVENLWQHGGGAHSAERDSAERKPGSGALRYRALRYALFSKTTLSISRVLPTRAATARTTGPVMDSTGLSVAGSTAAT